jgi:putative oxidoreductase
MIPSRVPRALIERVAPLFRSEGPALDGGLLFFRVALGAMMLIHGWPKLANFSERAAEFSDPLGVGNTTSLALAVFGEVFCSVLLILGAGTRLAAIPFSITMAVAAFIVHAGDEWSTREKAVFYLVGGLVLLLTGAGRFSVDGLLLARTSKPAAPPAS